MKDLLTEFFNQNELEKKYLEKIRGKLMFCHRCKNIWVRKQMNKIPRHCPYCNSPYYNKPRQRDIKKKIEFANLI